jgi:hypothetical protein
MQTFVAVLLAQVFVFRLLMPWSFIPAWNGEDTVLALYHIWRQLNRAVILPINSFYRF